MYCVQRKFVPAELRDHHIKQNKMKKKKMFGRVRVKYACTQAIRPVQEDHYSIFTG